MRKIKYILIAILLINIVPSKVKADSSVILELRPSNNPVVINNKTRVDLVVASNTSVSVNSLMASIFVPKQVAVTDLIYRLNTTFDFNHLTTTPLETGTQVEIMFVKINKGSFLLNPNDTVVTFELSSQIPGIYQINPTADFGTSIVDTEGTELFNSYLSNPVKIEYIENIPTPVVTPSPTPLPSIAPSPTITPTPQDFTVSNIKTESGKNYIYVVNGLKIGNKQYIDRNYKFTSIPNEYAGLDYIRTANSDKTSKSANFLSFKINKPAIIYIAHDTRIKTIPEWLKTFTKTGKQILAQNSAPFNVYEKKFNEGTVVLGGNQITNIKNSVSNYTVIIKPQ